MESYVSHTLKTFLSLNMYKHIGDDSRVHPLYDFTVTGRPISSGPCILNIPKELPKEFLDLNKFKDLGVNIYDIFFDCINMDNCIRSYDYKSAEMYALAYLSEDVKMQSAVANSDPHWMVAKSLFKNKDKIPEIYRVAGKISNYAIPYGITDESLDIKIMSLLGINIVGLGSKLKKAYAKNFPNAWKYLENNCYLNKSKSLYESPLGFKKDFKDVFDNKRGIRQIRNFPMQNLVADALQLACNKCVDYLYENGIELSMAQYDSIVLSSPKKEDLDKANDIVKDAMENCFEHFKGIKDLRMKVEIEDIRNV